MLCETKPHYKTKYFCYAAHPQTASAGCGMGAWMVANAALEGDETVDGSTPTAHVRVDAVRKEFEDVMGGSE